MKATSAVTIRLDADLQKRLDLVSVRAARGATCSGKPFGQLLSLIQFEQLRRQAMPFAEARGYLTDNDVTAVLS